MLSCCINAFLSRLELIWPISSLKICKMSKICIFGKKLQESMGKYSQGANIQNSRFISPGMTS